ncbi:MAG: VOC family protein [Cyanobacteria bacterium P01_E01_bin.34]
MNVRCLDHVVLTVRDIAVTCRFYERVLGMTAMSFGRNRTALMFGTQKINLHPATSPFPPAATLPTPGSADLCFLTDVPLERVMDHFQVCEVPVELGPVERSGAMGPIRSVYIRDPDGNLLEVANAAHSIAYRNQL